MVSPVGKLGQVILKEKQLWAAAAMVVVLLILVFGPAVSQVKKNRATRDKLSERLAVLEEKLAVLSGVDPLLVDERGKRMERVFPSKKPVVELISTLSQLAGKHNLAFGGVSLKPGSLQGEGEASKAKAEDLADLRFGFEVGGTFDGISNFLKELESVAPLMKVEGVGLTIKTDPVVKRQVVAVEAAIEVSAFYQGPPESLGSILTPVSFLSVRDEAFLNRLFNFTSFETVLPVAQTGKTDLFAAP